jgi:hypothetical protein
MEWEIKAFRRWSTGRLYPDLQPEKGKTKNMDNNDATGTGMRALKGRIKAIRRHKHARYFK